MITKENYHKLKKYLKVQPKVQIENLILTMELNEEEKHLLLDWYDGDTRVKMSMNRYICDDTCTDYLKKIFSKIWNYLEYQNVLF